MFLRRNRRNKNGESYDYWTLVESVRTSRGPRQRIVATIGKRPGLDEEARVGWEHVADILDGKARQEDFLKPRAPDPPACRCASAWWSRPRVRRWPMRSSTATAPM